jgi:hypothetical protein
MFHLTVTKVTTLIFFMTNLQNTENTLIIIEWTKIEQEILDIYNSSVTNRRGACSKVSKFLESIFIKIQMQEIKSIIKP